MRETEALLCLNAVAGLGSLKINRLLKYFGSARNIFKKDLYALKAVEGIGSGIARNIKTFECDQFLKCEYELMRSCGVSVISIFDQNYPDLLKEIFDPPIVLYCKGKISLKGLVGIALIGSRRASVYGLNVSKQFAQRFAGFGLPVVSGMARGIDTAAHTGALTASGCTIAVLGSGLAKIYPWENEALANKISCDGSVISEFPMQTPPLAGNFPRRNRIISGLSVGIVVVEASSRSGALITSRCALEQGREVFAVPGKIGTPQAVGTNRLIQQGAKLVCSVEDIFEELHLPLRKLVHAEEQHSDFRIDSFTDEEKRVFDLLNDEPCYIDNVVSQTNLAYDQSIQVLLALECKKVIRRLPGNYFIKII